MNYLDQCILCFCFSFGLGLGYFVAAFLGITNGVEEYEYHHPFIADALFIIINMASFGCSLYIICQLIRLSGKQQWNAQLASVFAGVVFILLVELSLAFLRK